MNLMLNINKKIDNQLVNVKQILTESLFVRLEGFFIQLAEYSTPIAAIIGAVIGLVIAIKTDSLSIFFGGFIWIFILILFHYIGSKLQNACQSTIENNPSSVASQDYLDVISLINLVGALISLIGGAYIAIKMSSFTPLLIGICLSLVLIYTIWVTLNPSLVSTYVEPSSSAGVDAIAILVLTNKIYLRANKIFFGLFPTIGAILLVNALYNSFGDPTALLSGGIYGAIGFVLVLAGLISPFLCYLIFIFSYMFLDVLRSILSLGKVHDELTPRSSGYQYSTPAPNAVPEPSTQISAKVIQRVVIGTVVLIAMVAIGIKGKEYYIEYQQKVEIERIAADMKKAEDERVAKEKKDEDERMAKEKKDEEDRLAKEKIRIEAFVSKAKKHLNGSSLDLLLEPDINLAFRDLLRTPENMRAFESYFSNAEKVTEAEGLIIGQGCKDACDIYKAFMIVDVKTGKVAAAINGGDRMMYFGENEQSAPPLMKKWVMSVRKGG